MNCLVQIDINRCCFYLESPSFKCAKNPAAVAQWYDSRDSSKSCYASDGRLHSTAVRFPPGEKISGGHRAGGYFLLPRKRISFFLSFESTLVEDKNN